MVVWWFDINFNHYFSADAKIFRKKINLNFAHQKLKNPLSKVVQKYLIFFLITAQAEEEFMFQNVAYKPTVFLTVYLLLSKAHFTDFLTANIFEGGPIPTP